MTTKKHRPIVLGISDACRAKEVEQEIQNFLQALNSYADRFASDPDLSFEQHLDHVIAAKQAHCGEEHRAS
jgi:hypothetical protein